MTGTLAELFNQFNPEEQALIRAAEAEASGIVAQGDHGVTTRLRAAGLQGDRDWILGPQDEARCLAAGTEFVRYHNVLWKRTDAASSESFREFLAQLGKVRKGVLEKYGTSECGDGIADLHADAEKKAWEAHARHLTMPKTALLNQEADRNADGEGAEAKRTTIARLPGNGTDQRAAIDAFISTLAEAGRRITRKDFWTVAGYQDPTEFERFQRGDTRTTKSAATAFNRVLSMKPDDFIRLLDSRSPAT